MNSFNNSEKNYYYYLGISIKEPIAKPLSECTKIPVILHLCYREDKKLLRSKGIASLRRQRLLNFCREAFEQNALLAQEDLTLLLCTSLSTIKRDIINLKKEGIVVPTRGYVKDIGKGVSFKSQIIKFYKQGYLISKIENEMMQPAYIIKKCIEDYKKVIYLHNNKIPIKNIHIITHLSIKIIKEYLKI